VQAYNLELSGQRDILDVVKWLENGEVSEGSGDGDRERKLENVREWAKMPA
jgi:hypothetical protein